MYIFLENILNIGRKELVQLTLTTMAMGCETSIFVDVFMAQLAKASMFSWATRFGAVPGSIPESNLTYNLTLLRIFHLKNDIKEEKIINSINLNDSPYILT